MGSKVVQPIKKRSRHVFNGINTPCRLSYQPRLSGWGRLHTSFTGGLEGARLQRRICFGIRLDILLTHEGADPMLDDDKDRTPLDCAVVMDMNIFARRLQPPNADLLMFFRPGQAI